MAGREVTDATRAIAAYDAMQRALYIDEGRGLYLEEATRGSAVAFVWPFSRALLGTLCLAGVPEHARVSITADIAYVTWEEDPGAT